MEDRRCFTPENYVKQKSKTVMNEININAVKKQLQEFTEHISDGREANSRVLTPLREEILELTRRGATTAESPSFWRNTRSPFPKTRLVASCGRRQTRADD